MTEAEIQAEILRALVGRTDLRVWRNNSGVAFRGEQKVRFGIPGQGDLSGILLLICPRTGRRYGIRLEIEVKSESGRQTPEQRAFQAMIERFGGLYILARSADDVLRRLP